MHLEQADQAFQHRQWARARQLYEEAAKPGRASASTPVMLKSARCSLEMRQYDDVIKDTSLALKLNSKDMQLLELRALAFYYKGDHEAAKKYYAQGLRWVKAAVLLGERLLSLIHCLLLLLLLPPQVGS